MARTSRLKLFIPVALFAILALFLLRGLDLDPREMPSAMIGKPLPDFVLDQLDGAGQLSRSDLVGRPVLLNVWATWCVTCRVEHPYLLQLKQRGVPIIGIDYKDEDAAARRWLAELGDPYQRNIADREGSLGLDLGVYGAPETFLVDAQGIIRYRHVGQIDERAWRTVLQPIYQDMVGREGAP